MKIYFQLKILTGVPLVISIERRGQNYFFIEQAARKMTLRHPPETIDHERTFRHKRKI